jgi:hypothetical protein
MNTAPDRADETGAEILSDAECLRLLPTVPIGRLLLTRGGLPAVRLVSFFAGLDSGDPRSVLIATADDDTYRAAERGDVVAFQVDQVDTEQLVGWSVMAAGRLSVISPDEAQALGQTLPARAWAAHGRRHLVMLGIETLDGRRIASPAET